MLLALAVPAHAFAATAASLDREATEAFTRADYAAVLRLVPPQSSDVKPSKALLRLAVQSATKLGRPEEGFEIYERLVHDGEPDDERLLRPLGISFLTAYVRDSRDHLRIAAYSALSDLSLPEHQPLFEDGLLDPSPLVRARAIEALGRAKLGAKSQALRRALTDDSASVRIAAMNVLSDAQLRFTPPSGLPLGFQTVTLTNSAGTSNPAMLVVTGTNPCEVYVPGGVIGGTNATWEMGGWQGDFAFLVLSLTNATNPLQGFPVLAGPSQIWAGVLDARGMATFSLPVPAGVLNGLRVYSQMLDVTAGTLNLRSVSTTPSTLIVF